MSQGEEHIDRGADTVMPGQPADDGPPPPPRQVGPYEVGEELGRGGMAVVYRARHTGLGRDFALKLLRPGLAADQMSVTRFRLEAQAAAALSDHPGIVPARDVGEDAGRVYYAMDIVEGDTFDEYVARSEPPPSESARCIAAAARAVEHAHSEGILHRDIKPGNLIVTPDGEVKLTDFGLAKLTRPGPAATQLTRAGALLGTPGYMSPEQAKGRPLDARADVYSLGATLWHALAGDAPFSGDSIESVLKEVMEREPTPPSKRNPTVPRALDVITLRCLEKDPSRRYHSAAELADDLERFLRGDAIHAKPPSVLERVVRVARRNPRAFLAGAVATVAVAGLLATLAVQSWRAGERARTRGDLARALAPTDPEQALAILRDLDSDGTAPHDAAAIRTSAEARRAERDAERLRVVLALPLRKAGAARAEFRRLTEHWRELPAPRTGMLQVADMQTRIKGDKSVDEWKHVEAADRRLALEGERERAYTLAWDGYQTALELLDDHPDWPEHAEVVAALGALATGRLREAENAGDAAEAQRFLAALRALPGDHFQPLLRGDGSLTVASDPAGATVELHRYVDAAGYRSTQLVRVLGGTPLAGVALPMGPHHLVLKHPRRPTVHLPVYIARAEAHDAGMVLMPSRERIGEGYVYIPPGDVVIGGDTQGYLSLPRNETTTAGYCMAVHEVTVAQWRAYIEHLVGQGASDQELAPVCPWLYLRKGALEPGSKPGFASFWRVQDGRIVHRATLPEDAPMFGIRWVDAVAYAKWRSAVEGRTVRLPTEPEWARAARGVDERPYPWGDTLVPDATVWNRVSPQGDPKPRLLPVGTAARDVSPFGVRDLGGSVSEWTSTFAPGLSTTAYVKRGGAWFNNTTEALRACTRSFGYVTKTGGGRGGIRLVAELKPPARDR